MKKKPQKNNWEEDKEFFDQLAEKLEELFPKGKCKERSQALLLNAFANIFHNKRFQAEKEKAIQEGYNRGRIKCLEQHKSSNQKE